MNQIWKNTENILPIVMSVAIPSNKNIGNIIWLALESLKNQINIDFGWELLIIDDNAINFDLIKIFFNQLPNCQRILFKISPNQMLLDKWIEMSKNCSLTSNIFVMQNADEYSSPKRLSIHHVQFQNRNCLISTQFMALLYDLNTKNKFFYYGINKERKNSLYFSNEHLSMAVLTKDMIKMRRNFIKEGINKHIKYWIGRLHNIDFNSSKYIFTDYEIDNENWKYSIIVSKEIIKSGGVIIPFEQNVLLKYNRVNNYIPQSVIKYINNIII